MSSGTPIPRKNGIGSSKSKVLLIAQLLLQVEFRRLPQPAQVEVAAVKRTEENQQGRRNRQILD